MSDSSAMRGVPTELSPIPKVFHRIWLDDPMPATFAGYWETFRALHPGWDLRDWRASEDVPWHLCHNRDLIQRADDICPRDSKRFGGDLLRLELLWIYGGIYVDADVEPLKAWDQLTDCEAFVPYSPNRGPGGKRLLTQCVIAARPHHPFIGACLQAIPESVELHAGEPLARMVGPWMVTRVWESDDWDRTGLLVLPEQTFGPQSIRDRDSGKPPVIDGATFGWHHWNSSARRRGKGAR